MNTMALVDGLVPLDFGTIAFRLVPLGCLAAAAALGAMAGPEWSARLAPLPWLISIAFVGLPHGALDLTLSRRACRGWSLAAVWLIYAALMACVAAGFALAPWAMLALFAALSCWHFGAAHADGEFATSPAGSADTVWSVPAAGGRHAWPTPRAARAVAALARGSAVLAAPLLAWPAETVAAANTLVALTHRQDTATLPATAAVTAGWMFAAVGVLALGFEAWLARHHRAATVRLIRLAAEITVIVALGFSTHPLFSVGLYFLVWHGWRQMEPLAEAVAAGRPESWITLGTALARIHVAALPLLVPAWIAIGAAWWTLSPGHAAQDLALLSIAAYLVVTPAHELLGDLVHTDFGRPLAEARRLRATPWRPTRWSTGRR